MNSDEYKIYIKMVYLNAIYNFVVYKFLTRNYAQSQNFVLILDAHWWVYKMSRMHTTCSRKCPVGTDDRRHLNKYIGVGRKNDKFYKVEWN